MRSLRITSIAATLILIAATVTAARAETWFGPAISSPMPSDAIFMCADFLNGDGDLDIVTSRYDLSGYDIYFGDGLGHFTHQGYRAGWAAGFDLGDVDGDGDNDLVGLDPGISIRYNDGSGLFTSAPVSYPSFGASGITVSDLDGDGYEEVVVSSGFGQASLHWGAPGGPSAPPDEYPIAFDGNGCPDAVVFLSGVADFTGDGIPDILFSVEAGSSDCGKWVRGLKLFTGLGSRQFSVPSPSVWIAYEEFINNPDRQYVDLGFGDADGDLDVDVVAVDGYAYLRRLRNTGGGVFLQEGPDLVSPGGKSAALSDFDSDGVADLAWSIKIRTSIHQGSSSMEFPQVQQTTAGTAYVIAADVDGVSGTDILGVGTGSVINVLPNIVAATSHVVVDRVQSAVITARPAVASHDCTISVTGKDASALRAGELNIYDAAGGIVRTVRLGSSYEVNWDLRDKFGGLVPTGVYWVASSVLPRVEARRVVVIR